LTTPLDEQQFLFPPLVAALVQWAYNAGYTLTEGEAYRTPEQAAWNAAHGSGIAESLHTLRLAHDFNLWKDGVLLTGLEDYRPIGEQWKSMHPLARWGGDFTSPDADHFSLTWEGVS
jgi:hypothetical protein